MSCTTVGSRDNDCLIHAEGNYIDYTTYNIQEESEVEPTGISADRPEYR